MGTYASPDGNCVRLVIEPVDGAVYFPGMIQERFNNLKCTGNHIVME